MRSSARRWPSKIDCKAGLSICRVSTVGLKEQKNVLAIVDVFEATVERLSSPSDDGDVKMNVLLRSKSPPLPSPLPAIPES